MTRIVILTGVTGVDDPWHNFDATSHAVASCLCDAGWNCTVATTAESACVPLKDADLLIVNAGRRSPAGPEGIAPDQLLEYLESDRPVMGLHTSANTFGLVPQWAKRLGVRWIDGVSGHPPIGWYRLDPVAPALRSLDEVVVYDELYTNLDVLRPATVLMTHQVDAADHPLALARVDGAQRTIYDALGHGTESYASCSRRELLRREVHWLLGGACD